MKTGTSYLQQLLTENKDTLAADGVLFPGRPGWGAQVLGVRDVLGLLPDEEIRASAEGAWKRILKEIRSFDGPTALLSMEFMSFTGEEGARTLVESLAPAEVHVVLTVRDAGRVLPAQWQESTQNRGTASWPDYIEAVLRGQDPENRVWRTSMRALNIPRMLRAWAPQVPPERLHVVVVPPPGSPSTELWERFTDAVGLEAARYHPPRQVRNPSLGLVSADLMRRVNVGLQDLPIRSYQSVVKAHLCKQALAARSGEPAIPLTAALAEFAQDWNRTMIEAIARTGAQVHGDLQDIAAVPRETVPTVEPVPEEALLDAAGHALEAMQQFIKSQRRPSERQGRPEQPDRDAVHSSWLESPDPVAASVADVTATIRVAATLRKERRDITRLKRTAQRLRR